MTEKDYTRYETYRAYNDSGELLYVGVSMSALFRISKHSYHSGWYEHFSKIEIDRHDTHEEAYQFEKKLIVDESPKWNVVHSKDKKDSQRKKEKAVPKKNRQQRPRRSDSIGLEEDGLLRGL